MSGDSTIAVRRRTFLGRSRRRFVVRAALAASDTLALLAAGNLATIARFGQWRHVAAFGLAGDAPITFARISLFSAAIWLLMLWFEGLYDLHRVFWGTGEYSRVVKAVVMGAVGFIIVDYIFKLPGLSRLWMLLATVFAAGLTIFGRAFVRAALSWARRHGRKQRPTLVVGANEEAAEIARLLGKNPEAGLTPVGCVSSSRGDALALNHCGDLPYLGEASDLKRLLAERYIDTVVIASTAFDPAALSRLINDLRGWDGDIQMSSGLLDVTTSRILVRELAGIPLITIRGVSFAPWKRFVKRTFDLVVGGLIILVGSPIWLLLALVIKATSRGPVLYRQRRVGRAGEPFDMFKFRSMYADADARLAELQASGANEATGPLFKMKDDPRVTPVGKWMRKFSIDEFPQLLNVMRGNMSLVGPRPPLPVETVQYTEHHWRRMEVLPGMTGLWQVSGRSRLTFDEMIRLDLFYIENWTVGFDLGLLVRTIPAVLFARGAY
jgi:exopolysaccharide biosynthesis polyprenyl glycosylphosphotransferase